ncbi:hypothetical protein HRW23_10980 [Streptomyces lunaelactis]|uniref:hypothetical protein n=1 Tax=Streptomyces lunaelactis TaxID=1535768 RepID=UPI0015856ACA|nr:hypothetical protein [Streptomyces lunaelactis]NUK27391.1 hypothetical protein [Streptomyces lunaelactis]NUK61630.1 hypothetical protein [Streptomyces lunaelactis]NUK77916.1 hypothetical protein [Streptomyces lunaelactis]
MNDPRVPYDDGRRTPRPDEAENEGYSATALGSHWFERPEPEPAPETTVPVRGGQPVSVAPDRVEGEVLRFGPGVTAVVRNRNRGNSTNAAQLWHGTLPGQPAEPQQAREPRSGGLRRYALAAIVLLAVLAFLAWQRHGPGLAVEDVAVQTAPEGPGCDGTADVVAVLETNGRPGTVTYRWVRSDGTTSEVLREKMTRGQEQARLHLLWTFHGRGAYRASAELRITSPSRHTVATRFTYRCV